MAFKDATYDHLLKNNGISMEKIIVHIQNDIIMIEWKPGKKMNISMRNSRGQCACSLMADERRQDSSGKAYRSPDDPNVLYALMVYSEFHDLDIAIDTLNRCVDIVPLYSNDYVALGAAG
ncbi:hypothetical protein METP1_00965 [Methanosarcinales archaeon]|nr:hypothetical protein METP1_00965 [Methanosarcinales archaeon]